MTSFKNGKTQLEMKNNHMQSQIEWLHDSRFIISFKPRALNPRCIR